MVAGSSRLVWGGTQLGLLAFGIVAGIGMVGVSARAGVLELGRVARLLGPLARRARVRRRRDHRPLCPARQLPVAPGRALRGVDRAGRRERALRRVRERLHRRARDDRRRLSPRPPTVGDAGVRRLPLGVLAPGSRHAGPDRPHHGARDPRVRVDGGHPRDRRVDRVRRTRCPVRRRAPHLAHEGRRPRCGASGERAEGARRPPFRAVRSCTASRAGRDRGRRRRRVLHVARRGPADPQRDRGAEQRLAVRPPGGARLPVGEVDGARLVGGRRRRARRRARDRRGRRPRTGSTPAVSWTPASPTACCSCSLPLWCSQRSPSSGRFRFSATRAAAVARTPRAVRRGRRWPSSSSCSRSSSSSSSGRCSGSRSARAGRPRQAP